jgi:hypothetical protein
MAGSTAGHFHFSAARARLGRLQHVLLKGKFESQETRCHGSFRPGAQSAPWLESVSLLSLLRHCPRRISPMPPKKIM